MIRCDYSNAPDCSECNEPICRRGHYHSQNDWDFEYDLAEEDER